MRAGPECRDLPVEVMSLLFWHTTHAHVLTCCTNIMVSRSFTVCALSPFEVCKCSGNSLKALCCLLLGGLLVQDDRFNVAVNLEVLLPDC